MHRSPVARGVRAVAAAFAVALVSLPRGAGAFEFFEGRLQIHGFYEAQIRSIARDFDPQDGWDLTQWYNVLNVELEGEVAPDGFGPFDVVSTFLRLEVRYDCVWTRACGLFSSADAYGDRAGRLPGRVTDARQTGLYGHIRNGDQRTFTGVARELLPIRWRLDAGLGDASRVASPIFDSPGITVLATSRGPDGILDTGPDGDDPFFPVFGYLLGNCRFGFQGRRGSADGVGNRVLPWTPATSDCIEPLAPNAGTPNPFRGDQLYDRDPASPSYGSLVPAPGGGDFNDRINSSGKFELPLRPAPLLANTAAGSPDQGRGIWLPNPELARLIRSGELDSFDQRFRQAEFEWNRGASQQDEKELKEAYVDLELFESRLWLRLGKQQIVWGKTELFRTTDQFNPQDLGLASIPSLEESRIALWSARAVWSFYDLGPLEDARLELAANFDQFEPADIGRCGEPYAPLPGCDKTFGLLAHGLAGVALAGERRPPDPWNDAEGIEFGARFEWRWDRFSFALADFYGYEDFPYVEQVFAYSRNVDPASGLPRRGISSGRCATPAFQKNAAFNPAAPIGAGNLPFDAVAPADLDPDCLSVASALAEHHANQTVYHLICGSTIGFNSIDLSSCAQSLFNSDASVIGVNVATILGNAIAGNPFAARILDDNVITDVSGANGPFNVLANPGVFSNNVLVGLNVDPCDGFLSGCRLASRDGNPLTNPEPGFPAVGAFGFTGSTLDSALTTEQQALLGCGEFYGTDCERQGIDLLNAEASVLLQSWPGIEGTGIDNLLRSPDLEAGDTAATVPQPGTEAFRALGLAPPVGTRFDRRTGQLSILPGAHPQSHPDWDALVDGCVRPDGSDCAAALALYHPLAGIVDPALLTDAIAGNELYDCDGSGPLGTQATPCQVFDSELAALSWNFLMLTVANSTVNDDDGDGNLAAIGAGAAELDADEFDPSDPLRTDGCSFRRPSLCETANALWAISGVQRRTTQAGGNGRFGRRDFTWHGGSDGVLRYQKRNVLGFSVDAAEDVTKSNVSLEFTWINDIPFDDSNEFDGLTEADAFNLTTSVDRPTFINFLNPNRTVFFNSQLFLQYVDGYRSSFTANGPWNALATFSAFTGYFQDRLNPSLTFVYDVRSNSGAFLPSISYRFTEVLTATVGLALFAGREEPKTSALVPFLPPDRAGRFSEKSFVENGLSGVRERDEAFLSIQYTF